MTAFEKTQKAVDYTTGTPWLCSDLEGNVIPETEVSLKDDFALATCKVEFFALTDGSMPALETIRSITDLKLKAIVFRSLRLLETFGNQLGEPDTKHLRNGIYELRTKQGSDIFETCFSITGGKSLLSRMGLSRRHRKPLKQKSH